ncbi:transglutaminase-like domain-containing protein [Jidongwangia harbinensis]|uniref:transglutaminase-like domain-containing protein n=1 Tax=Jidongwangia harbinensis TaxID=2878561 RepID=UPI001CDA54BD|nr:transglutaminase-like domain-containing protein [Jidongwangia harbinensis]MCA2218173.1 transglutaminase-like domain-containing protein [Jidongwangia harbinensis]
MERDDRLATGVVLAAAVAGLHFTPVYGLVPLLLPVGVPAAAVLTATWLCARRPGLVDWRPLLTALAGLLTVAETALWHTTLAGLPTGRTVRALVAGATGSGELVLQSTWPARADPELVLFVPLLVTLAAVLGVEVLLRLRSPLVALLPSLAVLVLGQVYAPLPPGPAGLAALAYAAAGATLLAARATVVRIAASAAVAVLAAGLTVVLLPDGPARYTVRDARAAPLDGTLPANPLDEIAYRLAHPSAEAFRVDRAPAVDRWPLVVLDGFDGVNWTAAGSYRRLGAELPRDGSVTVGVRRESADLTVTDTGGPWLPSQPGLAAVEGASPLVAERYRTLVRPDADGALRYRLSWWQPQVDAATLGDAAVDPDAPGGLDGVGEVPDAVADLAEQAVRGLRPSFRTALLLENHLRTNYRAAVGQNLPTGHAWPQLTDFLLVSKRGTSEQFAAAYVALARVAGIPARLAVGYRMPARRPADGPVVVRNGDVLAWPEVAVRGVGWVPLDPIGAAAGAAAGAGLAAPTEQARTMLAAPDDLRDPPPPTAAPAPAPRPDRGAGLPVPWAALLAAPLVPLLGWPVGVPVAWLVRSWRRRRRPGAAAVVGAWEEVRDRLRAYGVATTPAMTVRELAVAAGAVADAGTVGEIGRLATVVDHTLWSAAGDVDDDVVRAWASVRVVRRGLARRDRRTRLRALLDPRPLRPPRPVSGPR